MNNPTLYLVAGIFLILFFCVMIYFFTKTFRALHVVFLFFTFSLTIWFLTLVALEHKTKLHWRKQVDRLSKELDTLVADKDRLVNNYVLDEQGNRPETVLTARRKLNRIMLDRGRVWRGCTVGGVNNGLIQVNTAAPGDAAATPNQIDENSIMYAFLEVDSTASIKVPGNFLGEFQATAVSPTTVTLKPTDQRMLLPSQLQTINGSAAGGGISWSLYEIMPIDSHLIYSVDPNKDVSLTAVEDQNIFGDMDAELVQQLYSPDNWLPEFRANLGLNAQQEQVIRNYLTQIMTSIIRNGGRPSTGNGGVVDPEDNIYVKVQFEQDLTVDVDSDTGQGALTSDYFDSLGRAAVDRLMRSELGFLPENERTLTFKKGDFAVFHKIKADELVEQNIVKPIEPRYVRKLIDFTFEFHKMLDRRTKIFQDVRRLQGEIAATKAAEAKSAKQRDFRKGERDKLLVDKQKFATEQQRITTYAGELRAKQERLKNELSVLYRANAAMAARLASVNNKLTEEIERRTTEATASR